MISPPFVFSFISQVTMSKRLRKPTKRYSPASENINPTRITNDEEKLDSPELSSSQSDEPSQDESKESSPNPPPIIPHPDELTNLDKIEKRIRRNIKKDIRAILKEENARKRRAPSSDSESSENEEPKKKEKRKKISNSYEFNLEGIPLGLNVREEIVNKILEGKFVHMSDVLAAEDDRDQLEELVHSRNDDGVMVTSVRKARRKILSWFEWSTAWTTYSMILYEDRMIPDLPIKMAKHFMNVSELKKMNKNWRAYDENFRRLVEKGRVCWGQTSQEAYSKAMMMDDNTVHLQRKQKGQTLFCFNFNKGQCRKINCSYIHRCSNCRRFGHGAMSCFAPQKNTSNNAPFRPLALQGPPGHPQYKYSGVKNQFKLQRKNNGKYQN